MVPLLPADEAPHQTCVSDLLGNRPPVELCDRTEADIKQLRVRGVAREPAQLRAGERCPVVRSFRDARRRPSPECQRLSVCPSGVSLVKVLACVLVSARRYKDAVGHQEIVGSRIAIGDAGDMADISPVNDGLAALLSRHAGIVGKEREFPLKREDFEACVVALVNGGVENEQMLAALLHGSDLPHHLADPRSVRLNQEPKRSGEPIAIAQHRCDEIKALHGEERVQSADE